MKQFIKLSLIVALVSLISCEDDKNSSYKLGTNQATLKTRDSLVLDITPSADGLSFESTNPFIAECVEGKLYSYLAGEAQIRITSKSKFNAVFNATVTPRTTLYKEPTLLFGSSPTIIKSKETRTFLYEEDYTESGKTFYRNHYKGENDSIGQTTYIFDESRKLIYIYILAPETSAERIEQHMNDRFLYIKEEDDMKFYLHPIPPSSANPNEFVLVTYSAFIDKNDPNNSVHIAVDYQLTDLGSSSESPASIKKAAQKYISDHRKELRKRLLQRKN